MPALVAWAAPLSGRGRPRPLAPQTVPRTSIRPPAFRGPPDPLGNEHTFSAAFDVHQGWGRPAAAPTVPSGDPATLAQVVRELRDAQAEASGLRSEVRRLRAEVATAGLGKATVDFLPTADTLREWGRACRAAESYVHVVCFTFDHPQVVGYLEQARGRGLTVKVLFSFKDKGTTTNQGARLQTLRGRGCEIRGHRGSRLHAKVLMTEREMILGSCNFTTASMNNVERSVLLQELSEETLVSQRDWFEQLFDAAIPFMEGLGEAVPPSPQR